MIQRFIKRGLTGDAPGTSNTNQPAVDSGSVALRLKAPLKLLDPLEPFRLIVSGLELTLFLASDSSHDTPVL